MSAPPVLPIAPQTYDPDYVNRINRVLTQYFTQVGNDIGNTAGSTINAQFNSLGVGTAPSGTAGDIKATTIEAALIGNASTATTLQTARNINGVSFNGSADITIAAKASGAGGDAIFYENGQTVTTNYTITTNANAVTAGPIAINSGVTVTVPTGSTWTIV